MLTVVAQDVRLFLALIVVTNALAIFCGIFLGANVAKRNWKRLVLRKQDGSGALRLAIIPKDDGSMELYIPNPALKLLKRGDPLEAVVKGSRGEMVFRVVSDKGRN